MSTWTKEVPKEYGYYWVFDVTTLILHIVYCVVFHAADTIQPKFYFPGNQEPVDIVDMFGYLFHRIETPQRPDDALIKELREGK